MLSGLAVVLVLGSGCHSTPISETASSLSGTTITYRFPIGRLYRSIYREDRVHFELLEPVQSEPPTAVLPYRSRRIREGLYLVVWEGDFAIRTTLLIDLPERRLHASALLEDGTSFFETATIESIEFLR